VSPILGLPALMLLFGVVAKFATLAEAANTRYPGRFDNDELLEFQSYVLVMEVLTALLVIASVITIVVRTRRYVNTPIVLRGQESAGTSCESVEGGPKYLSIAPPEYTGAHRAKSRSK